MTAVSHDSLSIGDALARHYVDHNLPNDGGEHEPWFRVRVGRWTIRLPNPPARQRAVFFHDVNHIITGYNTTFSDGEMLIAGYELASGCGPFWMAWLINLGMFALGLVVCPRPMFQAFVRGRRASSIYTRTEDRATLSAMTVAALKRMSRVDVVSPPATVQDRVRFAGWAILAGVMVLGPLAAMLAVGSWLF
ncbi:MAG: hypothetical protein ACREOG_05495 [Gemmatimonadaceae bacterium]